MARWKEQIETANQFWDAWHEIKNDVGTVYYPEDFEDEEDKIYAFGGCEGMLYSDDASDIYIIKFWNNGELKSYQLTDGEVVEEIC